MRASVEGLRSSNEECLISTYASDSLLLTVSLDPFGTMLKQNLEVFHHSNFVI
jgi:hypothetical protein